jgi:hypothetical protein
MPQDPLHFIQIHPCLHHSGCAGMPQIMEVEILNLIEAGFCSRFLGCRLYSDRDAPRFEGSSDEACTRFLLPVLSFPKMTAMPCLLSRPTTGNE